jgi:hypothetical protein
LGLGLSLLIAGYMNLILGPEIFAFFFVFSMIFKIVHYAWFNYATHSYSKEGTLIVNLNKGFYIFINFFAFGLYYRKNNHLWPDLFNPSKFSQKNMVFPN